MKNPFEKLVVLNYRDQFIGKISLAKTIGTELGFNPKKEYSEGVGFDYISLYDVKSGRTIVGDALSGKYTYNQLVQLAKSWYDKGLF